MVPEVAAYFMQMKRAVQEKWDPRQSLASRDLALAPVRSYALIILEVRLDRQGSVVGLSLTETSGLAIVDDSAIQAFMAAQPFGEVPTLALDESGEVCFPFRFVFRRDDTSE